MAKQQNENGWLLRQILSVPSARASNTFDPWNSASTGHQVADGAGCTEAGWKEVRQTKLAAQMQMQMRGGAERKRKRKRKGMADDGVGEWMWLGEREREDVKRKGRGEGDIRGYFGVGKKRMRMEKRGVDVEGRMGVRDDADDDADGGALSFGYDGGSHREAVDMEQKKDPNIDDCESTSTSSPFSARSADIPDDTPLPSTLSGRHQRSPPAHNGETGQIFRGLTFYVNGSMAPQISDHKLKHLLVANGASVSISLARKSVTHVLLGNPNVDSSSSSSSTATRGGGGAGGGLAAGKLQHEIQLVGGKGIKYVGVEWVLESVKAGRRLPEARFANLHLASGKQRSVIEHFARAG